MLKLIKRALAVYTIGAIGTLIALIITERSIEVKVAVDDDWWLSGAIAAIWPIAFIASVLAKLGLLKDED